jgi:multidrug resistance protein, MATE family
LLRNTTGAGRKDRVSAATWQGIYLSVIGGILYLGFIPLSGWIFGLFGHDPAVRELEATYFGVLCVGTMPVILSMTASCFYSGRGETNVVMFVNFLIAAVNIVLDYVMIFGAGPIPAMGIAGAAWATNIAYSVGSVAFLVLLARPRETLEYQFWSNRRYDGVLFRRMLRYGLPVGFQFLADVAGVSAFILLVGMIGKEELAATGLAFNLNSLVFIPMFGVGTAVMTLVGKRIGEGKPELAVRTTWLAVGMTGVYVLFFAAIYVFVPGIILYPYSVFSDSDEFADLSEVTIVLLRFVALYSIFDAMAVIFGSAVRGAGDTRFSLIFTLVAAWTIMVLPTFIGRMTGHGSLNGAWWACTVYIIVMGVGYMLRFQAGRWKSMRVIEDFLSDAVPAPGAIPDSKPLS